MSTTKWPGAYIILDLLRNRMQLCYDLALGNAGITRLGQLERLYGVDIVVSNEIKSDVSNSYRNLVCVKGAAWGLCSQRNMEIEFQKQITGQYWDIVWTHRIGVDILDPNTYVIVSSKQD